MSELNLNLLPSQAKFQAAKIKLTKQVRLVMIGIASAWVVAVLVVFSLNLIVNLQLDRQNKSFKSASDAYVALKDNIIISQRLKYKAKLVGGVLSSRFEYGKAFEIIKGLFPEGITMTNFELKDRGGFAITAKTFGHDNINKVEQMMADINSGKNQNFSSARLTLLNYSQDNWNFMMEVALK